MESCESCPGRQTINAKIILALAFVWSGGLLGCSTTGNNFSSNTPSHPSGLPVLYRNTQYDFTFFLPAGWQGYSMLAQQWDGETYLPAVDRDAIVEHGPEIVLRNPQWKPDDRCQDIRILVFTRRQWDAEHHGKFVVGVGGFDEEIAHNPNYVFAISSRFNADDSVKSWEEAGRIVDRNKNINAPHLYPE
jgi:hypothetical protein